MINKRSNLVACAMVATISTLTSIPTLAALSVRSAYQNAAVSVDAASSSVGEISVDTPTGALVEKAFLYTADTWGNNATNSSLAGNSLISGGSEDLGLVLPNTTPANSRLYDVTSIIKPMVEGTNGLQTFSYSDSGADGSVLMVIYSHESTAGGTAIVMDGELAPGGDTTTLTFDSPYTGGDIFMSLASSYSYNGDSDTNATGQVTNIDVTTDSFTNRRLSGCAGGNDDGNFIAANGELITAGGIGDSPNNPDPNCAGGAGDDEFYNLAMGNSADSTPFLQNNDTFIQFDTNNPTFDDNVFLLAFSASFTISEVDDTVISDPNDDDDTPPNGDDDTPPDDDSSTEVSAPSPLMSFTLGMLILAGIRRRYS